MQILLNNLIPVSPKMNSFIFKRGTVLILTLKAYFKVYLVLLRNFKKLPRPMASIGLFKVSFCSKFG